MRYNFKYFYSLKEFIDLYYDSGNSPFSQDDEFSLSIILTDLFGAVPSVNITGIAENEFLADTSSNPQHWGTLHKLFMYLINRFGDEAIGFGDIENPTLPQLQANDSVKKTFKHIVDRMVATYPKYKKLLDLYASEQNKLLDDLKNYVKFDDAPQTPGSYGSSEFLTTYTEYGNEVNTKIMRLKEIENNYSNLMNDWCDEFQNLFIEV